MIYFKCKNCGALIKVSSQFAGRQGNCARCGAVNQIPTAAEAAAEAKRKARGGAKPSPGGPPEAPAPEKPEAPAPEKPEAPAPKKPEAPAPKKPEAPALQPVQPPTEVLPPARPPRPPSALPFPAGLLDRLAGHLRGRGAKRLFPAVERISFLVGAYALVALAPAALVLGVGVLAGKTSFVWTWSDKVRLCLALVVSAVLLVLGQYVVAKVRTASRKMIAATPGRLSSTALPDCLAVLLLAAALVILPYAAHAGYETGHWGPGLELGILGLVGAALCLLLAVAALNPNVLNVHVRPGGGPGAEVVGFFSFLWKLILLAAPVGLMLLVVWSLYRLALAGQTAVRYESIEVLAAAMEGVCRGLIGFVVLYVVLYVLFLAYHLLVDLVRAVFEVASNTRKKGKARASAPADGPETPPAG